MRQSFKLLSLVFIRECNDLHRWIMDSLMIGSQRDLKVLRTRWKHAANNAIMELSFACDHRKQLPERAESLLHEEPFDCGF